ncbi:uncharacterized protein LOC143230387 [Tachypleus tridentatus]|uniref:uncharacterized protein LOC143230387 n=1 Tax=Tachypleus tridentatus TaxID=6853 RepID=UPI003FD24CD4
MRWKVEVAVWISLILGELHIVFAHVALTFPPARKYDLDFLDNGRTKSPCGMPKGDIFTSLPAGASINVSWHLAYPHKGGFKLELLGEDERLLEDLTPTTAETNYIGSEDSTAQMYTINLPKKLTCKNCTIRLLRQAKEWGNRYLFWSCADVSLIPVSEFRTICSNHGKLKEEYCVCDRLFSGNVCQYKDECWADEECGPNGKCISVDSTSFPKKQCFCEEGWFGENCNKESSVKSVMVDLSKYTQKELSDDYRLYWRIIEETEEIEAILKVNGSSFVALGWRPQAVGSSCKAFPVIRNRRGTSSLESETDNKTNIINGQKGTEEPVAEPPSEPSSGENAKNDKTREKDHRYTSEEVTSSNTNKEPGAKNPQGPLPSAPFGGPPYYFPPSETSLNDKAFGFPTSGNSKQHSTQNYKHIVDENGNLIGITLVGNPQKAPDRRNFYIGDRFKRGAQSLPESEASAKPSKSKPSPSITYPPISSYTPRHEFHAMDCTDIVIGVVRGKASRISDYYTRDRSTPRVDSYYGGTDSLTAAVGAEDNGVTTVLFRKKVKAKELTDHTIENSLMNVIWAKGQEPGMYIHRPETGLEAGNAKITDFYRPDEIKYHGHGKQRGKLTLNFFDGTSQSSAATVASPSGEWKYPHNCIEESCQYHIKWKMETDTDDIHFVIHSSNGDKWTGVGFSENPKMPNSDAVIGWVNEIGQVTVIDAWLTGYEHPKFDDSQDIKEFSGEINDGKVTLRFRRKRKTGDVSQDVDFTAKEGLYFLFPIKGGNYDSESRKIQFHEQIPVVSSQKFYVGPSSELDTVSKPEPTSEPNAKSEPEPTSEPNAKSEPEPTSEPNAKSEPEPTSQPGFEKTKEGSSQSSGPSTTSSTSTTTMSVTTPTTFVPRKAEYNVELKLPRAWKNELEKEDSEEYRKLEGDLLSKVSSELRSIDGFKEVKAVDLKNIEADNDTVLVKMMVVMVEETPDEGVTPSDEQLVAQHMSTLTTKLNSTVSKGFVGDLEVDPAYLVIQPSSVVQDGPDGEGSKRSQRSDDITIYIIIAGIAALVVLVAIQATFMVCRNRKRKGMMKTGRPKDCECAGCKGQRRNCYRM